MSKPRTLTLEVPTPESLGLSQVKPECWEHNSTWRCITIIENPEGANLEIDSTLRFEVNGIDVQLPSLDHALVALGLILGKVG